MAIAMIHGFLKEKQKSRPEWGRISIVETVLIETDSAEVNMIELLTELPASPNTITSWNPKGISFTFDLSLHPDSNVFVLRSAGDLQQVEQGGCFWEIELTYAVFSSAELVGIAGWGDNNNPKKRKDQREVIDPTDRPYVWHTSTSTVTKETYRHATSGDPIVHTNGLPITTPFRFEEIHRIHTFSYNVDYTSYNNDDYDDYVGLVNTSTTLGYGAGKLKFVSFQANEEYESIGQGVEKLEFHYVRVTLNFEYNPSGWDEDAKVVSMSTLQLTQMIVTPFLFYYDKIRISATEYAQEPWPLDANGLAIPYDDNDPADYGYVNHGYPKTGDLSIVTAYRSLAIP